MLQLTSFTLDPSLRRAMSIPVRNETCDGCR
jgi:hypothetical protein